MSPELPAGLSDLPDLSERLPIDASDLIFDEKLRLIREEIEAYQRTLPKDVIMSSVFGKHKVVGIGSHPPVDHLNSNTLYSEPDQQDWPPLDIAELTSAAQIVSEPAFPSPGSPNLQDLLVNGSERTENYPTNDRGSLQDVISSAPSTPELSAASQSYLDNHPGEKVVGAYDRYALGANSPTVEVIESKLVRARAAAEMVKSQALGVVGPRLEATRIPIQPSDLDVDSGNWGLAA